MAIVKMKFVSTSTNRQNLDEMLVRVMQSKLLNAELATSIIPEDSEAKVLNEDNIYSEYIGTLKNLAHGIGLEIEAHNDVKNTYTKEELDEFVNTFSTKLEMSSVDDDVLLTGDDQKALDALSECDFEKIHSCQYIQFGLGRLPIESAKKLELLDDVKFDTYVLHSNNQYRWIVFATSNTYYAESIKLLKSLFFEEIKIPSIDVKSVIAEYKDKLNDIYSFCAKFDAIYRLYEYVVNDNGSYSINGFIPADDVETYKQCFSDLDVKHEIYEPKKDSSLVPPTKLHNNWFFRPFEMFVDMYQLPSYFDFDPTAILGFTYCILFGIMFGDMGQGLVLFLVGTFFYDIKKKNLALLGVMSRIGIFSMIFGFFFGSVFGLEELLNPIHQKLFGVEHKLIEVMSSDATMIVLGGAVAVGMTMILGAMALNIYKNFRRKDYGKLLFSTNGVAGVIFYGYVAVAALNMFVLGGNVLKPIFIIPFVVVPFLCFFFEEPLSALLKHEPVKPHEGWGGYIMQMIFELIVIILEFVSNTMSFLRVGGFVLSHAGMMLVVTTLMQMCGAAGPIVLVFGNLFVMALEGLVVGIQSLRLEYYEMFSRYYDGGGKKYEVLTSLN